MKPVSRALLLVVLGSLFCSGLAGLLYQVVWTRYLALFLGHTSYAVVAVLVAFMGGLALGNAWLGPKVDRYSRPLFFYALLELGIGIYALAFPSWFEIVREMFLAYVRGAHPTGPLRLAIQFGFAGLLVLPPAVLMGATLPALTRFATKSLDELRGRVAALYAINSAGAVLGVILADWWLIPTHGLELTALAGAGMSLLVALVSAVASKWAADEAAFSALPTATVSRSPAPLPEQFDPAERRIALIGAGVSGFVAMLYEVAWTRLLGLSLGSSVHAYSLMLATFIAGLAMGSGLLARWRRPGRTLAAFGWAELALAATTLTGLWFYDLLPYWFVELGSLVRLTPRAYPIYEFVQALLCCVVMLPPALALGLTLPLASRVATASVDQTGRAIGRVFAINTLGTVLGAALTGFILLPVCGLGWTLAIGGIVNGLLGIAALAVARDGGWTRLPIFASLAATIALGLAAGSWANALWPKASALGLWRVRSSLSSTANYRQETQKVSLAYQIEAAGASVAVLTFPGDTNHLSLKVNGKTDASTTADVPTQLLLGHLPLLLHPAPQEVAIVGSGSGMTAGAVTRHPSVTRCDVIELIPEMYYAARTFFAPFNDQVFDDPRVHIQLEDAKTYLQTTTNRYDVIISEPSNPWLAGVAGVFTVEYYQSCLAVLRPNGLMVQWLQLYETDDETVDLVLRTFTSVFPHAELWRGSLGDVILVGALTPFPVDLGRLAARASIPAVATSLGRIEILSVSSLLAHQLWSQADTRFVPHPVGRIHSDYLPALEYLAQRGFFVGTTSERTEKFQELELTRSDLHLARWWRLHPPIVPDFLALSAVNSHHQAPAARFLPPLVDRWQKMAPTSTLPAEVSGRLNDLRRFVEVEIERLQPHRERLLKASGKDLDALRLYARWLVLHHRNERSALNLPDTTEADLVLARLAEIDPANRRVWLAQRAELAWDRGDDTLCGRLAEGVFTPIAGEDGSARFSRDPAAPQHLLARLIEMARQRSDSAEGRRFAEFAVSENYAGPSCSAPMGWLEVAVHRAMVGDASSATTVGK